MATELIGNLKLNNDKSRQILLRNVVEDMKTYFRIFCVLGNKNDLKLQKDRDAGVGFFWDKKILNTGIYVPPKDRGGILADVLMEILFRVSESINRPLKDTTVIRKPIFVKKLMQFGFLPKDDSTQVEILPHRKNDEIPRICLVQKPEMIELRSGYSSEKIFYHVVERNGREPNPKNIIPIQTRFHLGDTEQCTKKRETVNCELNGRIQIFPNRVKRILGV